MTNRNLEEERVSELLRRASAAPGDRAWALALERIAAEDEAPPWLAWALRPLAIAAAAALCAFAIGLSLWWASDATSNDNVVQQVLAAGGVAESTDLGITLVAQAANDSGTFR
jgi:hypothetical protein